MLAGVFHPGARPKFRGHDNGIVGAKLMNDAAAPAATAAADLGPLPEWDLSDLYPGRDSPELARDLGELATQAAAFRARYEGRLAALTGADLGAAVAQYEKQQEVAGRIMSYAELVRAGNVADPEIARFF